MPDRICVDYLKYFYHITPITSVFSVGRFNTFNLSLYDLLDSAGIILLVLSKKQFDIIELAKNRQRIEEDVSVLGIGSILVPYGSGTEPAY